MMYLDDLKHRMYPETPAILLVMLTFFVGTGLLIMAALMQSYYVGINNVVFSIFIALVLVEIPLFRKAFQYAKKQDKTEVQGDPWQLFKPKG
ncbi:MAG: hypothetical protein V7749_01055 [Cocleimonas sp.]